MSSYGRYRSGQGAGSFRSRSGITTRRNYTPIKKMQGSKGVKKFKPRFATVGFNRDVEKKYLDRSLIGGTGTGTKTGVDGTNSISQGMMWSSLGFAAYDFKVPAGSFITTSNNLLKGVTQGTTASTRIGNLIRGRFLKGAMTLQSAKLSGPSSGATSGDMNGESIATPSTTTTIWQFLRTTWRVVIVKDLQVNSVQESVEWDDVFESNNGNGTSMGECGGVHAELKIANMGRFRIISDNFYKTDAVNPQVTVQYMVNSKDLGSIRYNGPGGDALTDKGIHVIFAAYCSGVTAGTTTGDGMIAPILTMHSRLCFTDA